MRILTIRRDLECDKTSIYDLMNEQEITCLETHDSDKVISYLQMEKVPTDYLMIPLNKPYKERAYRLGPDVKVVIAKDEVIRFLTYLLGEDYMQYAEEAAAAGGNTVMCMGPDIMSFISAFYHADTKEEAEACYNKWQEYIPMNEELLYKILRTLESYREELLNYFEIKEYIQHRH